MNSKALIWTLRIRSVIISAVGVYEFIKLKFNDYLLGKVESAFIDTSASAIMKALQYSCVIILFAAAGYWLNRAVSGRNSLSGAAPR